MGESKRQNLLRWGGAGVRRPVVNQGTDAPARLVPVGHSARLLDSVLAAVIIVRVPPTAGSPMTWAQLAMAVLVLIALFRRPTRKWGGEWWVPALFGVLVLYTSLVSLLQGVTPWKREAVFILLMSLAAFLATGRIDVGSVLKGLAFGLVVNTGLFFAGVAPDDYAGALSGYLQDKNAAALYYAVAGILVTLVMRRMRWKLLALTLASVAVILTGSRTTMAAGAAALVWLLFSARLQRWSQLILGALIAAAFVWANVSDYLVMAVGRTEVQTGSDQLRARIDAASSRKVGEAPWFGSGVGQAHVTVEGNDWFFNSSYQGLYVEGGIMLAVCIVGLYAIYGLGLRVLNDPGWTRSWDTRAVTGATILIFFCAVRLGEVWLSPIGFLVLGVAFANYLLYRGRQVHDVVSQTRSERDTIKRSVWGTV